MKEKAAQLENPGEKFAEKTRDEIEDGYYYLLDLERSLYGGRLFYWRPHRRGYTDEIGQAGIYQEEEALQLAIDDQDKRTVLIKFTTVKKLMLRV